MPAMPTKSSAASSRPGAGLFLDADGQWRRRRYAPQGGENGGFRQDVRPLLLLHHGSDHAVPLTTQRAG